MPFNPPIPQSNRRPEKRQKHASPFASLIEAERMIQVSFLLPSSAFVGWLIGAWLDKTLHQTWISLVGIIFGGISGLVYVVRLVMAKSAGADRSRNDKSGRDSRGGKP
jgi:ATP synthase protein I